MVGVLDGQRSEDVRMHASVAITATHRQAKGKKLQEVR
jgi:hypothetical protein